MPTPPIPTPAPTPTPPQGNLGDQPTGQPNTGVTTGQGALNRGPAPSVTYPRASVLVPPSANAQGQAAPPTNNQ